MNVLVVGKGGREHALALAASKSKLCTHLYMAPGNPGMAKLGTCVEISDGDIDALVKFAKENHRSDDRRTGSVFSERNHGRFRKRRPESVRT